MNDHHLISSDWLSLHQVVRLVRKRVPLALSEEGMKAIAKCRSYLENRLSQRDELLYGINTGFGSLCNIRISQGELQELQENLVRSHACGTGAEVPAHLVRLMLFLKIQSLAYGYSGVRTETLERLIYFYNNDLLPVVYTQGSLGASGDLAPLAHLSLPLIGEGYLYEKGSRKRSAEVLQAHGLDPLKLGAKEGLALLNGTQFMLAYGVWAVSEATAFFKQAGLTAALSADVYMCKPEPFLPFIHQIRPHPGQKLAAEQMLKNLEGSEIIDKPKVQVQDPYSFRCIPQVHGASWDALQHVQRVMETELNAVTDNPNVFPDEDLILSGGNFHGQPLALSLDFLAIAMAELGSISERRTYLLIGGKRELPEFLVTKSGLHSGFMIPQYAAAALVSENKQLCTPASVDSIPSSNGQEDHVSMGANAAVKVYRVLENLRNILAIEWLTAAQALEFRRPARTSPVLEELLKEYRKEIPAVDADRILHDDIMKTVRFWDKVEA